MWKQELLPFAADDALGNAGLLPPLPRVGRAAPVSRPHDPTAPALRLCVLGSGSGGNCTVVQLGEDCLLIDAGFGPQTIARRLGQAKSMLGRIRGVCLTHLDQDHFRPHWIRTLLGWRIPLYVFNWHHDDLRKLPDAHDLFTQELVRGFDRQPFSPLPGLTFHPIHLRHDRQGTCGFRAEGPAGSFGYATDLGCVTGALLDHFTGVDLLALESNYDVRMQQQSTRPEFLKRRIMGEAGHLSNDQALQAVREIDRRSGAGRPRQIVLLHRSAQCNTPEKVLETFADPDLAPRIHLTQQRRRSRWFEVRSAPRAGQLAMTFE